MLNDVSSCDDSSVTVCKNKCCFVGSANRGLVFTAAFPAVTGNGGIAGIVGSEAIGGFLGDRGAAIGGFLGEGGTAIGGFLGEAGTAIGGILGEGVTCAVCWGLTARGCRTGTQSKVASNFDIGTGCLTGVVTFWDRLTSPEMY